MSNVTASLERVKYVFIWLCLVHVLISVWVLYRGRELATSHLDAYATYYREHGQHELAQWLERERDLVVKLIHVGSLIGIVMHSLAGIAASREWYCSVLAYGVVLTVAAIGSLGHFLSAASGSDDSWAVGHDGNKMAAMSYTGGYGGGRISCMYMMAVVVNWAHMFAAFRLAFLIRRRDRDPELMKLGPDAFQGLA